MHSAMRQTGHKLPVFAFVIPIPGRVLLFAGHQRAVAERQLEFTQTRLGAGNLVKVAVLGFDSDFHLLHRAQDLRGDDVASACKTCDCYLRNAPRLRKRLDDALRALKALVGAATTAQRPAEAATRLAQFVERGEAPAEDLLVLEDLWAAAGRRPDAAQALVRRAEILLHQGRVPQARSSVARRRGRRGRATVALASPMRTSSRIRARALG